MKKILFGLFALSVLLFNSCTKEHNGRTSVDGDIDEILAEQMLKRQDFWLPGFDELDLIPQSLDNEITQDKIDLGRSIFWDPIFNQNTFSANHTMTASCGSCHANQGHSGRTQGIGEGGIATGFDGMSRTEDGDFISNIGRDTIDAQPIRVPTHAHVAYKGNALWNGALGNPNVEKLIGLENIVNHNEGIAFPDEFPHDIAREFDGFGGAEMQAMAGLRVHRYKFDEEIINNAGSGYKLLFDQVFVNDSRTSIIGKFRNDFVDENDMFLDKGRILLDGGNLVNDDSDDVRVPVQYSRLAAALAVSAYTRSVIAHEAPFQDYVKGNPNGMTEQQKRGFKVFLEKKCINCHNGPALTDADFHAMGTKDLLDVDPNLANRVNNPIAGFIPMEELDAGRQNVSGREEDRGAFMTQTLYNLPNDFLFHGGENIGIKGAVEYMLAAEMTEGKDFVPDPLWTKQTVTDLEKADLIEFITNGLTDRNFDYKYRPGAGGTPKVLSCDNTAGPDGDRIEICSPNSDNQSKSGADVGAICCDQ